MASRLRRPKRLDTTGQAVVQSRCAVGSMPCFFNQPLQGLREPPGRRPGPQVFHQVLRAPRYALYALLQAVTPAGRLPVALACEVWADQGLGAGPASRQQRGGASHAPTSPLAMLSYPANVACKSCGFEPAVQAAPCGPSCFQLGGSRKENTLDSMT